MTETVIVALISAGGVVLGAAVTALGRICCIGASTRTNAKIRTKNERTTS